MRRCLVGWLLALAAAPLAAQTPVVAPQLAGAEAVTACIGDRPVSVFAPLLDSLTAAELGVHEAVHRRQLAAGCRALIDTVRANPARLVELEHEALCAGLAMRPAAERDSVHVVRTVAYLPRLTPRQFARLTRPCPD